MFEDREKVSFLLNSSFTNHKLEGRLCMDKLIQSGELTMKKVLYHVVNLSKGITMV